MPSFTPNQWAILFLVLVLGWLLGLLSRSGGAKWRRAYEAERDARADELAERDTALTAANARIAELERERDRLAAATPTAAPAAVAATPVAATPVVPATTPETLDLTRDDLSIIRGIGPEGAAMLYDTGIYRYAQIASMSRADEHALEDKLGADRDYIDQEQWREQAQLLADGKIEEHRRRFG